MTQEEIIEGNELVAKFMGDIDEHYKWDGHRFTNGFSYIIPEYHSSWDWLILVINKIYNLDWYYKWKETSGQIEKEIFINTKFIQETYKEVIEFIKWYNLNNKKL